MLLATFAAVAVAASQPSAPRRFAIAVGDNQGDADDPPLRFAETDARQFEEALRDVVGVLPGDGVLLAEATAEDLRQALQRISARLASEGGPTSQLFVYVSSHADEGELHLSGTHFPLQQLSDFLKTVPAAVAVLIVDSCRSGALTRLKGLAPLPGFSINLELPEVRGRVVITSSGADEYAQESDGYRGSYFTHHLIAALRGAADLSHDGHVTLQEAYSYAYRRTVETTFATRGGTQHPSFRVDLKGQGDLVLSDLSRASGRLALSVAAPGRWLVSSAGDGALVDEFEKPRGKTVFALAPGAYVLKSSDGSQTFETRVTIPEGGEATVTQSDLTVGSAALTARKGGGPGVFIALAAAVQLGAVGGLPPLPGGALFVRGSLGSDWLGVLNCWTGSAAFNSAQSGGAASFLENELTFQGGLGHHWRSHWFAARLGVEMGLTEIRQSGVPSPSPRWSTEPFAGLRAEGQMALAGPVSLVLSGFAGPALEEQASGWGLGAKLEGSLGVAFEL